MSFTGLTRRLRGPASPPRLEEEPLIGAADRTFACPGCARPLVIGQGRCPGCGSLLVAGIRVRTALVLVLVGSVVGMVGGAMIAGVATSRLAAAPASAAASSAAPVAGASAAAPTAAPVLPPGVAAGILQVASVNDRLSRSAAALRAALGDRASGAGEIAPLLRKIAADVRSGDQAARRLAAWSPATELVADVTTLYGATAASAADGLAAPLAARGAYRTAGWHMLKVLAALPGVAKATSALAAEAGVALPEAATP